MKLRSGRWSEARAHVLPLRIAVFVEEQGVPLEMEEDEDDPHSLHAWLADDDGRVIATGRLLPDGHIGRMAVDSKCRGQGFGTLILNHLIDTARCRGLQRLVLHAQTSAQRFYDRLGFVPEGDVFMEAGIPHQLMSRRADESVP